MAIDVNDPLAENLNDINDVDKVMPGFLKVSYKQYQKNSDLYML
jgi:inorganic pyrophosphatase